MRRRIQTTLDKNMHIKERLINYAKSASERINSSIGVLIGEKIAYNKKEVAHHLQTYSQEGEDAILRRLFELTDKGFYIDIGAHHPQRFSNTYFFYLKGWNGINIEPRPGSSQLFNELRPRDINLELGISQ